eukprot:TRINITY_DN75290_c0_g1_i1.p1 TRINITY_DN75290_c0_g1~~TRINITY_DN75290_c0_g1_i1.p1  ORF type:complete len:451 (+),score=89.95 TRINITY_DN75290_c0_g1_i1:111-1463(+)
MLRRTTQLRHGWRGSWSSRLRVQCTGGILRPQAVAGCLLSRRRSSAAPPAADWWTSFCERWNADLNKYPMPMVVFFGTGNLLCWAVIFSTLSASTSLCALLARPEFAVGWLVKRCTGRVRLPLHLALAAPLSAAVPALSKMKVSPLLAAVVADPESRKQLRNFRLGIQRHDSWPSSRKRSFQRGYRKICRLAKWVEGPIDKFGLSYFITSQFTGFMTISAATYGAMHGLDVPGMLTSWGFSGDLQQDAGLFAVAAVLNSACTPLHFWAAVRTVSALENKAAGIWAEQQDELRDMWAAAQRQQLEAEAEEVRKRGSEEAKAKGLHPEPVSPGAAAEKGDSASYEDLADEFTLERFQQQIISRVSFAAVVVQLGFAFYIMRRMTAGPSKSAEKKPPPPAELRTEPSSAEAVEAGAAAAAEPDLSPSSAVASDDVAVGDRPSPAPPPPVPSQK